MCWSIALPNDSSCNTTTLVLTALNYSFHHKIKRSFRANYVATARLLYNMHAELPTIHIIIIVTIVASLNPLLPPSLPPSSSTGGDPVPLVSHSSGDT